MGNEVNMSLFENNLAVLRNKYEALADKAMVCDDTLYRTVKTPQKGWLNLIYSGTEPSLMFYDPQNPLRGVGQFLKETTDKKSRFIILLGNLKSGTT